MKISILGFGRSGKSVAELAKKIGFEVFVSELSMDKDIPFENEKGKHTEKILDADIIVVSPGIKEFELLKKARMIGKDVVDEIEFASRYIKGKIIAVTGTNGKTTTASIAYEILKNDCRKTFLCGNIYPGIPMSDVVLNTDLNTITVIEVSSFQLERIVNFKPDIGIVLNISPDHFDRYSSIIQYEEAKKRIFMNQTKDDIAILNYDDEKLNKWSTKSKILYFSRKYKKDIYLYGNEVFLMDGSFVFSKNDLNIIGEFFIEDAMAASLACYNIGVSVEKIREGIKNFKGVPHRMEIIKKKPLIINNSMCTNPAAFRNSLNSMKGSIVFMGGRLKNLNPYELVEAAVDSAGYVILFGESKNTLGRIFKEKGYKNFYIADSIEEGVKFSKTLKIDRILFSPGGASQDMFKDFIERGEHFKELVRKYYD